MNTFLEPLVSHFNYVAYIAIMMIGLYAMAAKRNLMKKLIGMGIFQTSIMLLYVSIGAKEGASIPIVAKYAETISPESYVNPLPHVLMLTAIVVSVATLGVALCLVQVIYKQYKSLEEDTILDKERS
ncbi:cation:proton antiporter subunit C [Desulfohalovibrio reitneri]|uniref:cation:proton antiporter subunit C n=1 Tax=Desulfohalovibrio reitneri TaxID=1307759 RepID=UPI0004A75B46|nr:cation:proton antiporter subunit C [Desulfohalovibrio reitneri]